MEHPIQGQGDRLNHDGLLGEAKKELATVFGSPPDETELIQVVVERLMTDRALMGPHQPALEQRDDPMDVRQQLRGESLNSS